MTNMCRINLITVLTVLDILISYYETRFSILPSVFPDHQSDRPPALKHNYDGCGKGAHFLRSCNDYKVEPH